MDIPFTGPSRYIAFEFASEFFEMCNSAPPKGRMRTSRRIGSGNDWYGNGDSDWAGTKSFEEANSLARNGWKEGASRAQQLVDKLSAALIADVRRPEITFDVTGEMFDIGKVVDGEPECWMRWEPGQDPSSCGPVKIVYNICTSSGISPEGMARKGMATAALVQVLEASGRNVRLEVTEATKTYSGIYFEARVCIKDFYDPLQVDAIAYATMHASMLRRHMFAADEAMGMDDSSYGTPVDTKNDRGDIYIPKSHLSEPEWSSDQTALNWIKSTLVKQGVSFNE